MSHRQSLKTPWAVALEIADRPRDAASWQQDLAASIEAIVRPDAAGVFLCTLGNMFEASVAMAPADCTELGQRLIHDFLPRMQRAGLETPWELFSATASTEQRAITQPIRAELLEPAGFRGLIGTILRSRDGMIAGWIAVFSRAPAHQRLTEIETPLAAVCAAAQQALRSAIALASAVGARFPKDTPSPLSEREREIAGLAVKGFSDLNIAERLSISEGTVGRHLHNIYRKLGVSSRRELADRLSVRD